MGGLMCQTPVGTLEVVLRVRSWC